MGLIYEKQRLKISCYYPFKILSIAKNTCGKKYIISSFSTTKNMPKMQMWSSQVADLKLRTSEKIAIVELLLWSNISSKVVELQLRKCFIQV